MELPGTVGAAVILVNSGVCLAHSGNNAIGTTSQVTSGTTRLLRSKMRRIVLTGDPATTDSDSDGLEDVVLTYRRQYHLLRLLSVEEEEVFLHVVMARPEANLALTRHKVNVLERELLEDPVRRRQMMMRLRDERAAAERQFNREPSAPHLDPLDGTDDEMRSRHISARTPSGVCLAWLRPAPPDLTFSVSFLPLREIPTDRINGLSVTSVPIEQRKLSDKPMANLNNSLATAMQISGAIGIAIVDIDSGMTLAQSGGGEQLNLDVAAAGNTEVMRAKMRTMADLDLQDEIEDVLITLGRQYHIIRPIRGKGGAGLFMYLALEKSKANLALARHKLADIERTLTI
jgi:hypothetical protein